MTTTPTGIPIGPCRICGYTHPVSRGHCERCNRPSVLLDVNGMCLQCKGAA